MASKEVREKILAEVKDLPSVTTAYLVWKYQIKYDMARRIIKKIEKEKENGK